MSKRVLTQKFIKWIVSFGLGYLLYKQIIAGNHLQKLTDSYMSGEQSPDWKFLFFALSLMPINWLLEAFKWKILTSVFEKITFKTAFASVLSGVSVGILTPGRVGEYGGRLAYISPENHAESLGATFTGSIAQNTINLILALPLSYYFLNFISAVTFKHLLTFLVSVSVIVVLVSAVYFNLYSVTRFISNLKFLSQKQDWVQRLRFVKRYNTKLLIVVLILSVLRFVVYSLQYLCLIWCLGAQSSVAVLTGAIATIYLVQSGVPLPPLTALMARGELAILVWGQVGIDATTALASTLSLWIINLFIPALVGLYFIWKSKILDN